MVSSLRLHSRLGQQAPASASGVKTENPTCSDFKYVPRPLCWDDARLRAPVNREQLLERCSASPSNPSPGCGLSWLRRQGSDDLPSEVLVHHKGGEGGPEEPNLEAPLPWAAPQPSQPPIPPQPPSPHLPHPPPHPSGG